MSEFKSRLASRGGVKPVIAFYSESGGGKSYSSLLLARGLVGPKGNIQLIDTEQGRGELYSDVIPGGYNVIPFTEPFSPARYIEAIRAAEGFGADVIVIDQASSEWEGCNGVLDMAAHNEEQGKKGLSVWKTPKMEHGKFMVRLLQSKCPIIVCLRAKYKSRQVKQNGRTEIVRDEHLTPIQAEDFIFESTVHGYMTQDHAFHPVKISHPTLGACLPNGAPIEIKHGELLAKWCAASSGSQPAKSSANPLKGELWKLTASIHKGDKDALLRFLVDECAMQELTALDSLNDSELETAITLAKRKVNGWTV